MQIYEVTDARFRKYGKVIRNIDFSALTEAMKKTPVPSDVVYEPSIAELEALPVAKEIEKVFYGELPIQIGYCNGHNVLLNAVEYHRSSEINLAATDAVLILGSEADVTDDFTYETSKMEASRQEQPWRCMRPHCIMHHVMWTMQDSRWQSFCRRAPIIRWMRHTPAGRMHFLQQRINGSSVMPRAGCRREVISDSSAKI